MTWGFKEQAVAEQLKSMLTPGMAEPDPVQETIASRGLIFLTPSGGIPARQGKKCGRANCVLYYINSADEVVPYTTQTGSAVSLAVWNIATEKVSGDVLIQTKDILGKPVADWEPCFPDDSSDEP